MMPPRRPDRRSARVAGERALELDPDLSEALTETGVTVCLKAGSPGVAACTCTSMIFRGAAAPWAQPGVAVSASTKSC
jgi:hypothetical protein